MTSKHHEESNWPRDVKVKDFPANNLCKTDLNKIPENWLLLNDKNGGRRKINQFRLSLLTVVWHHVGIMTLKRWCGDFSITSKNRKKIRKLKTGSFQLFLFLFLFFQAFLLKTTHCCSNPNNGIDASFGYLWCIDIWLKCHETTN